MITKEKIEKFNSLESEMVELQDELKRINGFLNRDDSNRDNARAINDGYIFVKFAGTACHLPLAIFQQELQKRKLDLEARVAELKKEKDSL